MEPANNITSCFRRQKQNAGMRKGLDNYWNQFPGAYIKLKWKKPQLYVQKNIIYVTFRKHAYSNTLKILPPKNENFQMKNSDIFLISAQNIDCACSLEPPRRGGSNEYPQSMF